ncbi:MAG: hypothetical protein KME19_06200 [Microcoleus vaginatus WJT46-NPBG5]|jgi:hypothetical protein|nr:hypothetical protein [Microcoleus vaginatus WJT46-NPBG5]
MTSKLWAKSCKFSSTVGMTLGLLMPGLPLLAAAPSSGIVDNSSFTPSGDLLIAQNPTLCTDGDVSVDEYTTENYSISICLGDDQTMYYVDFNHGNNMTNTLYDVTTTRDGEYIATDHDQQGNKLVYTVGEYFRVTNNGDQVVYEKATNLE